ncbi:MAG: hypothetical protein KBS52_01850 [Clostridiales bacterium]|nr:hypothetical protein [Candidatus Equinaster intestinalis]
MLFDDSDVKIVGDKPSETVKKNRNENVGDTVTDEMAAGAKMLGSAVASAYIGAVNTALSDDDETDPQMLINRQILLCFTVSVTLDEFCVNDSVAGIAEKSFLDELRKMSPEIHENCSDTGAFSFYYLAYRRKTEVDRRIGQTFAMLCSHDGDSIYQELGEALYCWFISVVKKEIKKAGLLK